MQGVFPVPIRTQAADGRCCAHFAGEGMEDFSFAVRKMRFELAVDFEDFSGQKMSRKDFLRGLTPIGALDTLSTPAQTGEAVERLAVQGLRGQEAE